jgi:hypothetical protein
MLVEVKGVTLDAALPYKLVIVFANVEADVPQLPNRQW